MLDTPFAVGATADVHVWEPGWIIKLYRGTQEAPVRHEKRVAAAVQTALQEVEELRVPAVGACVTVNNRPGLLYEHIPAETMLAQLRQSPSLSGLNTFARQFAELHFRLHTCSIPDRAALAAAVPRQRNALLRKIETAPLTTTIRTAARKALERYAKTNAASCLCHGDFHPGNIILASGDAVLIDWQDSAWGEAAADVARTCLLLDPGFSADSSDVEAVSRRCFRNRYFKHYVGLCAAPDTVRRAVRAWLPVVAAARLAENLPETEREPLQRIVRVYLPQ